MVELDSLSAVINAWPATVNAEPLTNVTPDQRHP